MEVNGHEIQENYISLFALKASAYRKGVI